MKALYTYINESLLDDEDDIVQGGLSATINTALKAIPSYRLGKDGKTLVYDNAWSSDWIELARPNGDPIKRRGETWKNEDILTDDLMDFVNSAKLKFQPLQTYQVPMGDPKFDKIPVDWVCDLQICTRNDGPTNMDLSKLPFEVKGGVDILPTIFDSNLSKDFNIKAYTKHIEYVTFREYGDNATATISWEPQHIVGWDCEYLVIQCPGYKGINKSLYNEMQDWDAEKIQQFLDNNPKAQKVFVCENYRDRDIWYRVKTKGTGAKRKVIGMTPVKSLTTKRKMRDLKERYMLDSTSYARANKL